MVDGRDAESSTGTTPDLRASAMVPAAAPAGLEHVLLDRPLVVGEDAQAYDALLERVTGSIKPKDIIDAIWVKDIVDLVWEAQRLRRWKARLLTHARREAVEAILQQLIDGDTETRTPLVFRHDHARQLALGWSKGERSAIRDVDRAFRQHGYEVDSVLAQALVLRLEQVERIDRMIAAADNRRDAVLREIDRRRESLARQLRSVAQDIIDVEIDDATSAPAD